MAAIESLALDLEVNYSGLKSSLDQSFSVIQSHLEKINKLKMDWGNVLNPQGFSQMNWGAMISEMFTPATLFAMFSTMAALGIGQAMTMQTTGAAAGGAAGLTPGQSTTGVQAAQNILSQLGTRGGSLASITSMLDIFFKQFGSAGQATTLTEQLDGALRSLGESMNNFDASSFESVLGALQATSPSQVTDVTDALMNASKASGGWLTMSQGAEQLKGSLTAMASIGIPFETLLKSIVLYGSMIGSGMGIDQAQALYQDFTDVLTATNFNLTVLAGGQQKWINEVENKGPKQTMIDFANELLHISDITKNQTLRNQLGLNAAAVDGAKNIVQEGNKLTDSVNTGSAAIQDLKKNIKETETATDALSGAWQSFVGSLGKDIQSSGILGTLTNTLNWFANLINPSSPTSFVSQISDLLFGQGNTPSGLSIMGSNLINPLKAMLTNTPYQNLKNLLGINNTPASTQTSNTQNTTYNFKFSGYSPNEINKGGAINYIGPFKASYYTNGK